MSRPYRLSAADSVTACMDLPRLETRRGFSPDDCCSAAFALTCARMKLGSSITLTVVLLPDAGRRPLSKIFWIELRYDPDKGAACADVLGVIPLLSLILLRGILGGAPCTSSLSTAGLIVVDAVVFHCDWLADCCLSADCLDPVFVTVTTLDILNFFRPDEASERPLSGRFIALIALTGALAFRFVVEVRNLTGAAICYVVGLNLPIASVGAWFNFVNVPAFLSG